MYFHSLAHLPAFPPIAVYLPFLVAPVAKIINSVLDSFSAHQYTVPRDVVSVFHLLASLHSVEAM